MEGQQVTIDFQKIDLILHLEKFIEFTCIVKKVAGVGTDSCLFYFCIW